VYRDRDRDPQHWRLLIFYCNPENPRLFVPKRSGLPFTINFARPVAWLLTAGVLAVIAFFVLANNYFSIEDHWLLRR
jgi:uncharacterized membrane protein